MSQQLQITGGAKVRSLEGVITGSSGVLSSLPINTSNGIPQLDVNGKILVDQLPNSIMEYKGTWNASTNTPTLVDGTGNAGDVYLCNVAGTVNFGAGPITFYVGDQVLYSGTVWQRASGASGTVTSVGLSSTAGAFTITNSPITTSGNIGLNFSGNSGQYVAGDGSLVTFPSIISEAQNLVTEVYNNSGATMSKGTVVYINGGQGNLPTIAKAIATGDSTSAQTYGIVQSDITNMNNGYVVVAGRLQNIDTQAYTEGTQLYLSSTTAGAWTSTKQYAPAHLVYVGIVVRSHPTQGIVEIKIQNGYELDELHNVSAQTPSNNDGIFYNSSTSLWENKSIATALGYTPLGGSGTAGNVPYYTAANTLGSENGFMYDSSTNRFGVNTTVPNATIGANANIDSGYSLLLKNADANYNGIGFGINTTYGNTFETQKLGVANAMNLTLLNQSGYISLTEGGNLGINILSPIASPSGVGSKGIDIYGDSQAASIGFHNVASGTGNTNGAYLYLTNTGTFTLRNLEGGIGASSLGDFSVVTNSTENFRVNSSNGTIWQSNISDAMLKTVAGVLTAAVAGTDYVAPSALSSYVPTSRTITINGTTQDLSANRSWSVGTLTGGGAAGRVAFWDGASNVVSDSIFVWDDTNNRLGIGLTNPQRALEIYSASADTHLRLSGAAPSVSMGEAITGSIYQAKFGLATANNQFVTGSVAGDFVINCQTGSSIFAYNSTEAMRIDTNRNVGIGGIANSSYRLHVFGTAPLLGIESTTTGNVALRFLQAGTVVSGITYFNSDSTLRITNNNGGVRIGTSGLDPALTIASTGAATFSSSVTANGTGGVPALNVRATDTNFALASIFGNQTGDVNWLLMSGYPNAGDFTIRQSDFVNALTIKKTTGNVGIGTTSPSYLLTIVKDGSGNANNGIAGSQLVLSKSTANTENIAFRQTGGSTGISGTTQAGQIISDGNNVFEIYATAGIPLVLGTNSTERMRITSSGGVAIGATAAGGTYKLRVINSSAVQGDAIFASDNNVYNSILVYAAGADGYNGAGTVAIFGRNTSTSRSINAGGTINASGADYAEYMIKAIDDTIEKGDIVGVNESGLLTNIFADAKSFVVKSTDPSYVGGDTWGSVDDIGKLPLEPTKEEIKEHNAKLEAARAKVDRIAFSGQVPCNVYNAKVGDYIIPIELNGKISGQAVSNPTFEQYQLSVGKVWKIMEDGRAWIAVKIG